MDETSLLIEGANTMHGAVVDSHNDHRIAMTCAVVALGAEGTTTIKSAEQVKKSYPKFFQDLHSLGAKVIGWQLDR
jgi:3-phosphoshikimate 1-carboxyvinyltransferase